MIKQKDKSFYTHVPHTNEYRFSIEVLRDFMLVLGSNQVQRNEIKLIYDRNYDIDSLGLKFNSKKYKLKDYQQKYSNIITDKNSSNIQLVDLRTGHGKASDVDSLVRIPGGWKRMGDIQVNDLVIAKDGTATSVTAIHPQGELDLYRITFEDGRTHDCCAEHLWGVHSSKFKEGYRVINTKEIIKLLDNEDTIKYYIDLPEPESVPDCVLSIEPYEMGKLLRNQNSIPDEYKESSVKQKYNLLHGLLGINIKNTAINTFQYRVNSKQLGNDIVLLIRSLGGQAKINNVDTNNYNIIFYLNKHSKLKLGIDKVIHIGKKEAQCISIEHPDKLYVAEDYVVTHNTVIASDAVIKLNYRLGILILPKYIDKWIGDVKDLTNVDDEDIYIVRGGNSLIDLMEEENPTYKIIIFSMRTVANYIKQYEETVFTYPVEPGRLMEHLGIGTLLNDETHQEHHALFKASLYFEVRKLIGLSATLVSNQADVNAMYQILLPDKKRISNLLEYEKYLNVKAINYRLEFTRGIQYQRQQGYSHNLYEQSIMRNNVLLRDYIDMILYYIAEGYISRRKQGEKLLIFAASIRMCTILRNYVSDVYKNLDVRRYVEDDPYENLMEGDIVITTVLSAGTAIDVANLITVIQTISISSLQSNLQAAGRLRKLKDREVWYYYTYTRDIDKQYKMHKDRRQAIQHTTKEYLNVEYHKTLKVK